ncbi:MAG: cyclase family protein [Eubacteriaceae bacterium]|nr:cyclase family protein [Eubacteriaceae bacterium]
MKIYDVSMTIDEQMQVYKNLDEKRPIISITRDFRSSSAMESRISIDMHTGTHLDMPLHFIENGKSLDDLDLGDVVTPCKVFDMTYIKEGITQMDLEDKDIQEGDFILLKTANSSTDIFNFEFIYLTEDGAQFLMEKKIKGIGIDALGIERNQPEYGTHLTLLNADILIIEGLRLWDVPEGEYLLVAAPLKIRGVEGAPMRAILLEIE